MRTLMSRRRCTVSIGCAALLSDAGAVGQPLSKPSDTITPQFIGFSAEDRVVVAEINGTRLRIPRNFVEVAIVQKRSPSMPENERKIGWLRLVTFLPDFTGMTPERVATVRASSPTRYPDLVSINVRPNDDSWSQELKSTRLVQSRDATIPFKFGLLTSPSGRDNVLKPAVTEDGEPIYILLNSIKISNGYCSIDLFRWPDILVEYNYNVVHLDQWKAIDAGVTRLVHSILESH